MSKMSMNDVDQYSEGSLNFFTLKDDGDTKSVRFMYNSSDDIEAMAVHKVVVDPVTQKTRYVDCLRSYTDPVEVCPFCASGMPPLAKIFIPIWDIDEECVKVWERGKTFKTRLAKLASAFPQISQTVFDIVRKGESGSKDTQYEIYPMTDTPDGTTVEDLGEVPVIVGKDGFVLEKTADEMNDYLATGRFVVATDNSAGAVRRDPTAPGGYAGAVRRGSTSSANKNRPSF